MSRNPCLFPKCRREIVRFLPSSMILDVGFSLVLFIRLRKFPSTFNFLKVFVMNRCWILPNSLSSSVELSYRFLFFSLLVQQITFTDYICQTNFASLRWSLLKHDYSFFLYIAGFSLLIFCSEFLCLMWLFVTSFLGLDMKIILAS